MWLAPTSKILDKGGKIMFQCSNCIFYKALAVCSMPPRDSEDWGLPKGAEDDCLD